MHNGLKGNKLKVSLNVEYMPFVGIFSKVPIHIWRRDCMKPSCKYQSNTQIRVEWFMLELFCKNLCWGPLMDEKTFGMEICECKSREWWKGMGWNENINCFWIMLYHSKLINEHSRQVFLRVPANDKGLSQNRFCHWNPRQDFSAVCQTRTETDSARSNLLRLRPWNDGIRTHYYQTCSMILNSFYF